jgi:hypothetical protein
VLSPLNLEILNVCSVWAARDAHTTREKSKTHTLTV